MAEVKREVRTFKRVLVCDECGSDMIESYKTCHTPPRYCYWCPNCNNHVYLYERYQARIEYEEIEVGRSKDRMQNVPRVGDPNDLNIQHKYDSLVNERARGIDEMCEAAKEAHHVWWNKHGGYSIAEDFDAAAARLKGEKS